MPRGSIRSGTRGQRGRGQGRGRGRGRGGRTSRGGRSVIRGNGFETSRVKDTDEAASANGDTASEDDASTQGSAEDDQASGSENDDEPSKHSYANLLQALTANQPAEPPRKRRKVEQDRNGKNGETITNADNEQQIHGKEEEEVDIADAGLTEQVDAGDSEEEQVLAADHDSDDEEQQLHDPFENHYTKLTSDDLKQAIAIVSKQVIYTCDTINSDGTKKFSSHPVDYAARPVGTKGNDMRLKQRLLKNGTNILRHIPTEERDLAGEIFAYRDTLYGHRTTQNAPVLRNLACIHALNHIFKTRDRVLKNNTKISQSDASEVRDQGFTRPKVLFILPTKQACARYVEAITKISEPDQQENKSRFLDSFSAEDDEAWEDKPGDFRELFGGNHEEDYRVGLKFTRKTIKYFSGFYNSDIIFGSALGLMRTITTGGGTSGKDKKKPQHDSDFLSSIEVVIVDNVSAIQMQNWQHLEYVFTQLNLLPKDSHGCDFSRVRSWYLDGYAKHLRQTIAFTSFHSPELNSLFSNHTFNIAGRAKYAPTYSGAMLALPPTLPFHPSQKFLRFDSPAPSTDSDSRFTYFMTTILPSLTRSASKSSQAAATLLFIPTYADFLHLRNYFSNSPTTANLSFASISEYTPPRDVARARSHFMNGRHSVLLYTERAHHHFRYKIKGVKRIVFYGVPENPVFWPEIVGLLGMGFDVVGNTDSKRRGGGGGGGAAGKGKDNVRAMFSQWDLLKLERIVGTERMGKLTGEAGDVFEFY